VPAPAVADLLAQSGILHTLLAHGPTRAWGNAGRDTALRHIRDHALPGIVYLADDDNFYERPLFAELRRVKRVGVLPVGLLGPSGIERPILRRGRIVDWKPIGRRADFPSTWPASPSTPLCCEVFPAPSGPTVHGAARVNFWSAW
jgi:hypothetical protein